MQSVPGSDKYRLRSDESGYDNLVLAGDWTDCGINAGCIEAAVMSGLQAANALTRPQSKSPYPRLLPPLSSWSIQLCRRECHPGGGKSRHQDVAHRHCGREDAACV